MWERAPDWIAENGFELLYWLAPYTFAIVSSTILILAIAGRVTMPDASVPQPILDAITILANSQADEDQADTDLETARAQLLAAQKSVADRLAAAQGAEQRKEVARQHLIDLVNQNYASTPAVS